MKFNACFLLLWASITLIHAGPTHKTIEKKSLAEDTKVDTIKEDLKIEETGEQKDRSKKAAVCLQINPASPQVALNENFVQNVPLMMQVPQLVPQHVQTLNFVQPVPQNLPQASIVVPQQIIQASQPLSQANIVLPQQMLQPIHNVQIVQPSSEPHSANQIVQPPEELETDPQPEPTPSPKTEIESVTKTPNHVNTEKFPQLLPARQEALTVVPVAPRYQELMFTSEPEHATFVQVPSISACNHFHNQLTKCTCQNIEPVTMNMMPFMSYSSPYDARSSLMMPHVHTNDAKDYKTNQVVPGLQEKPRSLISMNIPHYGHRPHYHPSLRGMHYLHPETSLRNKYNLLSSPALIPEVHDLTQTNKSPRETDSSQLEKEAETKQAEGKATLIDGRRNARSNKEEIKEQEKQIIKT